MTLKTALIAAGALVAVAVAGSPAAHAAGASVSIGVQPGVPHAGVYPAHRFDQRGYPRGYRHVLSERAVRHHLHRQGFRDVRGLHLRGGVYVATATAGRGVVYRLAVDAYSGRVLHRQAILAPHGPRRVR